ncbi:MAG: DNA polymerase/3'-5' exonuclease PolX [Pirellulales bacterium]
MTNADIASTLEQIADLLEYLGENPFRCRAYRAAARTVLVVTEPLAELRRDGGPGLAGLEGIGADLAGRIAMLIETGRLPLLDELKAQVPAAAADLLRVPGLGPKKARLLIDQLGIDSLESLEQACRDGRVAAVKGFGEKTQQAILRKVAFARDPQRRRLLWKDADDIARDLIEWMRRCPQADRVEGAGSWRRGRDTVGCIRMVVASQSPAAVIDHGIAWPGAAAVLERVESATRLRGPKDTEIAIVVVTDVAFGAAMVVHTGSRAHTDRLRECAEERRLVFDARGVVPIGGEERPATSPPSRSSATEEDVYANLGLAWIPPELREGRDEILRAEDRRLPALVRLEDIRGDLHMHTTESDGDAPLAEMVRVAISRGLEYIAITDHGPRVSMANGLGPERLLAQWEEIDRLNASLAAAGPPPIVVLKGVEVDMLEQGGLDLPDDLLSRADWVVASLHYGQQQPGTQITARIIEAMEHPAVGVIGHPTGRLINRRPPYEVDMDAVIAAAARTGTFLEINANPWRLDLHEIHAAAARDAGVGLVISTDAHSTAGLDLMRCGVLQARRAGCSAADVVNTRSLRELRALMKRDGSRRG